MKEITFVRAVFKVADNEQGLLSVNEFKKLKMITELQKRFEADAYKQKLNYAGSAGIAAEQGFLAGIDFLQHLLQQTDCYTALEFLEQMLSKEQKYFGEHYFITDEVREKMSNIKNIQSVIQLIKERQANAV